LKLSKGLFDFKIPLKLLGEPNYVLTALKAFHGNLPINAVGFRKIKT